MKNILAIAVILVAGAGIYYWTTHQMPKGEMVRYSDQEEWPLTFEYRKSPDGYVAQELEPRESMPELIKALVLMLESDYQSILRGEREGGEGPPAITIQAFVNTDKLSLPAWLEANPHLSSFHLKMGEVRETTVAGKTALAYDADGLYPSRNVAFAYNENVLFFVSGSYLDKDSALYRDFPSILDSMRLEEMTSGE